MRHGKKEMSFKPELVIFDLDGTLVEFPHDYLYRETYRIIDSLSFPRVEQCVLQSCFSSFDYFRFVEESERDRFVEHFWRSFDHTNYPKPVPVAGALNLLKALSEHGLPIAIATARTSSEEKLRAELAVTGFLPFVSMIAPRHFNDANWMDKRCQINYICETLSIAPSGAVMVGDIPPDVISARQAGVGFTVAVLSGGINKEILRSAEPDLLLPSVAEIHQNSVMLIG